MSSENIRRVQQTRNGKYVLPRKSVPTKQMLSPQTKLPLQNFHAQQQSYIGKRASESRRKPLFITTKSHRRAKSHIAEQATEKVLSRMFRLTEKCLLTRLFQRFNGTVIIMLRRQTPSGSNLRGTPEAAIVIIHPRIRRTVKTRPHDLNMKRTSTKKTPRNIIMQRLPENSRARSAKSRKLRVTWVSTM